MVKLLFTNCALSVMFYIFLLVLGVQEEKKVKKMKFVAQLTLKDGSKILLPLHCREYHASKLQSVLSRTLDRSVFAKVYVLTASEIETPIDSVVYDVGVLSVDVRLLQRGVKNV